MRFFSTATFGVYLIHDNYLIRVNIIKNSFAVKTENTVELFIIVLSGIVAIFLSCILIEKVREYIFKMLKIKEKVNKIEVKLSDGVWD